MNRFFSENGISISSITTEQMKEIDRIAIEETGPNLYQMMENAGRSLAELALEMLGDRWNKEPIVVLAGTGGNGGGGICAARHLANRNAKVQLCLAAAKNLKDVTHIQLKEYTETYGELVQISNVDLSNPGLIIDALIGYSLKGTPEGVYVELIRRSNQSRAPVLSLDIPSGVDSTTGEKKGEFIHADRTLTLALPKRGLLPALTGELYLADLGIPAKAYERIGVKYSSPFSKKFFVKLTHEPLYTDNSII